MRLKRFNAEQREAIILCAPSCFAGGRWPGICQGASAKSGKTENKLGSRPPTQRLLTGFGGPWRAFRRFSRQDFTLRASGFDTRVSSTSYIAVALATSQDPSYRPAAALSPDAVTFKTTRSWFQLFVVNIQTGTTSKSFRRFGMVDCEGPTIPPSDLLGVC